MAHWIKCATCNHKLVLSGKLKDGDSNLTRFGRRELGAGALADCSVDSWCFALERGFCGLRN